jgi:hypothetical protein
MGCVDPESGWVHLMSRMKWEGARSRGVDGWLFDPDVVRAQSRKGSGKTGGEVNWVLLLLLDARGRGLHELELMSRVGG